MNERSRIATSTMNEKSRIATSIRMSEYANKKYRSRSSSASKEIKKPSSALLRSQHLPAEQPLEYSNPALSVESIPETPAQPMRGPQLDLSSPDLLSSTVENAMRKVLQGSLHDLQQDVNKIHRALSEIVQDDGNVSRRYSTGRPRVTTPNEDRYLAVTAKTNRRSTVTDLSRQFPSWYVSFKADRVQTLRADWSLCSETPDCNSCS
ncbi:paired domain-containing protein [Trichonephila clavipes]|nr:paired domain-containing protein [Trichonephila clavipes]